MKDFPINYQQSLPPLSIESRTNGLRFSGNPAQTFMIQRAPAVTGPWTTITTRNTPSASTLLQYDVTNPPPHPLAWMGRQKGSSACGWVARAGEDW